MSEINDGLICNFQRNEMKLRAEHFANNHSQRRVPCLKNKIPMILIISIELIRGSSDLSCEILLYIFPNEACMTW